MANASVEEESQQRVKDVAQQFAIKADEALAISLQDKEYDSKYDWNRVQGKLARTDVPLARQTYTEDEKRLQKERMLQLQEINKIAERDAEIIKEMLEKEERSRLEIKRQTQEINEKLAKYLSMKTETDSLNDECNDAMLAVRLQQIEDQEHEREVIRQEIYDTKLALDLQKKELSRKKQERIQTLEKAKQSYGQEQRLAGQIIVLKEFEGFKFDDDDDADYEEQQVILTMQDEELARVMQEHENKKARLRTVRINQNQVAQDAELARRLQETEHNKIKKAHSQPAAPKSGHTSHTHNDSSKSRSFTSEHSRSTRMQPDAVGKAIRVHGMDENIDGEFAVHIPDYSVVQKTVITTTTKRTENGVEKPVRTVQKQTLTCTPSVSNSIQDNMRNEIALESASDQTPSLPKTFDPYDVIDSKTKNMVQSTIPSPPLPPLPLSSIPDTNSQTPPASQKKKSKGLFNFTKKSK